MASSPLEELVKVIEKNAEAPARSRMEFWINGGQEKKARADHATSGNAMMNVPADFNRRYAEAMAIFGNRLDQRVWDSLPRDLFTTTTTITNTTS